MSNGIALIEHAISDRMGKGAVRTQRPFVRAGRVHQREVGVNVSMSVRHEYDQQRRTRCEAWCEERARAAAGAKSSATSQGRHPISRATLENSEVM